MEWFDERSNGIRVHISDGPVHCCNLGCSRNNCCCKTANHRLFKAVSIFAQRLREVKKCSSLQSSESMITETSLNKYCKLCWDKTGAKDSTEDCLCYVVSGTYSPATANLPDYCELKCEKEATSLLFSYSQLFKKITITC